MACAYGRITRWVITPTLPTIMVYSATETMRAEIVFQLVAEIKALYSDAGTKTEPYCPAAEV